MRQVATSRPTDLQRAAGAYACDGHVTVRGVVDLATVAAAQEHLTVLQAALAGDRPDALLPSLVAGPIEGDAFFAAMVADERLLELAAALLGREATAFGCTYVLKPPRVGLPVLWHQDGHPWRARLGITEAVTLWLALDEAGRDNGCLRVIPGSHRRPAQALQPNTTVPNIFGHQMDPALVDATRAVDVILRPGDVSAHHPNLVHGSEANHSNRPRTALALRYRARDGGKAVDEVAARPQPSRRSRHE